jgi:hypothetical protein
VVDGGSRAVMLQFWWFKTNEFAWRVAASRYDNLDGLEEFLHINMFGIVSQID